MKDFTAHVERVHALAEKPPPISSVSPPARALIQSSAEFVRGFIPPDYLIDAILQRGFLYSHTGKTGSGKTAVTLLIAASVALGRPVGAHEVSQGRVLYFAGENPDDIRMRWIAMSQNMGFDTDAIAVDFVPGVYKISEISERIAQEAQQGGPIALVIVDTSAAYSEGDDENNNVQQGLHARRLRSLTGLPGKPCVLVNCHPVKNADENNLLPRGGGAFIAEVDGNLTCRRHDGAVELHWQGKFRGPDFAGILFQLKTVRCEPLHDSKERPIPSVVAEYLPEAAQEQIAAAARDDENRLLAAIAASPDASMTDLAKALRWTVKNGDPNKLKVQRTCDALKRDNLITKERGGKSVLTDAGRKRLKADTPSRHQHEP